MHIRLSSPRKNAFSLVELSIVLVILGLLVGGVLSGQSLIRAAELRSVSTSFANYRAAMYSFRDKYFALPGDMSNATAFWTSAGGDGINNACITAQTGGAQATCNGTGDGTIQSTSTWAHSERFTAWKHLANAGLVEGSYTGKTTGAVSTFATEPGGNVAKARAGNAFFDISYLASAPFFHVNSKTSVNGVNLYGATGSNGAITPEEAWNIDTKLDDGMPYRGSLYTYLSSTIACADTDAADSPYRLTLKEKYCSLFYAF